MHHIRGCPTLAVGEIKGCVDIWYVFAGWILKFLLILIFHFVLEKRWKNDNLLIWFWNSSEENCVTFVSSPLFWHVLSFTRLAGRLQGFFSACRDHGFDQCWCPKQRYFTPQGRDSKVMQQNNMPTEGQIFQVGIRRSEWLKDKLRRILEVQKTGQSGIHQELGTVGAQTVEVLALNENQGIGPV